MVITSRSNPLVKRLASLKEKKYRREYGEFLIEGVKPVRECFSSSLRISLLVVSESYRGERFGAEAAVVSDDVFAYLSDEKTPQGILAAVEIPKTQLSKPQERSLLLDGVSDPGNMGTIIRTANAAGYTDLYLAGCTDPYAPKSVRASMSGIYFVRLHIAEKSEILHILEGIPLISADMDGENIFTFTPPEKFCLVIGNEANGISEEVMKKSEYCIRIPMRDTAESLNAGVSAGIAMYILSNQK